MASSRDRKNAAKTVDFNYFAEELPELAPIGDDEPYLRRAFAFFL